MTSGLNGGANNQFTTDTLAAAWLELNRDAFTSCGRISTLLRL
jgi:hypothetical protein